MTQWWKTAKEILKGKAKGAKLIVLGVFLVSIAVGIGISTGNYGDSSALQMLGIMAFVFGIVLYREEAEHELEKKKEKP
jgi:uncharacterized membrane protein